MQLQGMDVEIIQKNIKNLYLSVYPPTGKIKISAPESMPLDTIRVYLITKLDWIKQQQQKLEAQKREIPREYLDRESHYFKGKRYLLKIIEADERPRVSLKHTEIILQIPPNTDAFKRKALLEAWYRGALRESLETLIPHWEQKMAVSLALCTIRKMKTRWGSCSLKSSSIRINLELIKKPPECLEYVVVHELSRTC